MFNLLLIPICYLIGSIPTAHIISRLKNVDITAVGSGNPGATNVMRVIGPVYGIVTLLCDISKGFFPILLVRNVNSPQLLSACLISVVIGHIFPIFANFRGGKGVATAAGAILAIQPYILLISGIIFGITFWITKYVSLSSLLASGTASILIFLSQEPTLIKITVISIFFVILLRHKENLKRLLKGMELKLR